MPKVLDFSLTATQWAVLALLVVMGVLAEGWYSATLDSYGWSAAVLATWLYFSEANHHTQTVDWIYGFR